MKRVLVFLFLPLFFSAKAQLNDHENGMSSFRIGSGYTHDFPGLNGYSIRAEYSRSLNDNLQAAFAVQNVNLSGHPRNVSVNEFTKAITVDFNIYFVAFQNEIHQLRIGTGYSFSFYKIRRSYPVVHSTDEKSTSWPTQEKAGRISGLNINGEYAYFLPGSDFSLGLRVSLFKAYDQVSYVGPFIGIRL